MKVQKLKSYSKHLNREIEFNVYGLSGKPVLMFPTSNARFFQYEDFGMIEALKEFIDGKRIQVFTADSIDIETITNINGDPEQRLKLYEDYLNYITKELTPTIHEINGTGQKIMLGGCSMGGFHSSNLFFRYPELYDSLISMSAIYTIREFFSTYDSPLLRQNIPIEYLDDIEDTDTRFPSYLRSRAVLCCGSGAYEDKMLDNMDMIKRVIEKKHIPVMIDIWGKDVIHDWPWWHKQMPFFLERILSSY